MLVVNFNIKLAERSVTNLMRWNINYRKIVDRVFCFAYIFNA